MAWRHCIRARFFLQRGRPRCPKGVGHELLDSLSPLRYVPPPCLNRFASRSKPPPSRRLSCGGFFDVASAQRRLIELDSLMAGESFWNNRDQAQKLIDEAATLRKKIDPLLTAEKQLDDLRVMTELAEAEPPEKQLPHQQELERDLVRLSRELDALELKAVLKGPHDARDAIFSIQAGAGGTEAQDWAEMLSRMYGRWFDSRGWKWEVTDALAGDSAGL
ncbi:MAG TPA: PCRF domain-containing protein, partial [Candidatus Limnocylindria bacterium]|nr:PCRF domain-containing protein [Candidatus Limnocylindria bacterium]